MTCFLGVAPNGMVVNGSIKPVEPTDPTDDFTIAYESAQRSILRAEFLPISARSFPDGIRIHFRFDSTLDRAEIVSP